MMGPHPIQPSHEHRQSAWQARNHRTAVSASTAAAAVFENQDLLACILGHAKLDPFEFVAAGRVAKAWHDACMADDTLLLAAARKPDFLTKRTLIGLFALHWHEADKLPRSKKNRRNGGFLYMYGPAAIDGALTTIGGFHGWRTHIARRAANEKAAAAL